MRDLAPITPGSPPARARQYDKVKIVVPDDRAMSLLRKIRFLVFAVSSRTFATAVTGFDWSATEKRACGDLIGVRPFIGAARALCTHPVIGTGIVKRNFIRMAGRASMPGNGGECVKCLR